VLNGVFLEGTETVRLACFDGYRGGSNRRVGFGSLGRCRVAEGRVRACSKIKAVWNAGGRYVFC